MLKLLSNGRKQKVKQQNPRSTEKNNTTNLRSTQKREEHEKRHRTMIQVGEEKKGKSSKRRIYPNSNVINFYIVHTHGRWRRWKKTLLNFIIKRSTIIFFFLYFEHGNRFFILAAPRFQFLFIHLIMECLSLSLSGERTDL